MIYLWIILFYYYFKNKSHAINFFSWMVTMSICTRVPCWPRPLLFRSAIKPRRHSTEDVSVISAKATRVKAKTPGRRHVSSVSALSSPCNPFTSVKNATLYRHVASRLTCSHQLPVTHTWIRIIYINFFCATDSYHI